MNWLETSIAALAPRTALKRATARAALTQVRAYEAAQPGRGTDSWRRSRSGATSEVAAGAGPVRDRVRDLLRNNGYAQRAHRTLVSSTVGTGIVGSLMTLGDKPVLAAPRNREVFARFVDACDWDGHHDLYGLQNLAARTMFESGEALIRYRRLAFDGSTRVPPVRVQVLEPDFIDTTKTRVDGAAGYIDRGIEYDADGRKVALWLWPDHPGNMTPFLRTRWASTRVPLGEVEQVYDMLRPGQDRGISIFAGAVLPLKSLGDYLEAEGMRKRIEACLALFITSNGEAASPLAVTGKDGDGNTLTRLSPGMIAELAPGQDISTLVPRVDAEIGPFVTQMQFLAAAAGGVMFEHMTGNFANVNYSSYRVGSFDYARNVEQLQWLTLRPRMNVPLGNRFFDAARAANLLVGNDFMDVRWTPPLAVTSPDPKKDADADTVNMRNGTLARADINERRGWADPEMMERIAADNAASDAIGVMFDGDARKPLKGPPPPVETENA